MVDMLEAMAVSINKHFFEAQKFGGRWDHNRLKAGQELIEARALVEHGQWIPWCKKNIKRSVRDIQQVMKMAGAPDPEKALATDRKRVAIASRNTRCATRISEEAKKKAHSR